MPRAATKTTPTLLLSVLLVLLSAAFITPALAQRDLPPKSSLPWGLDTFQQLGIATQNTYCGHRYNQAGQHLDGGNLTIINSIGDGGGSRRITFYYDKPLDAVIVAVEGTNQSNYYGVAMNGVDFYVPGSSVGVHQWDAFAHAGYYLALREVLPNTKNVLRQIYNNPHHPYHNKPLYVTGHSQGAGVGGLLATTIEEMYPAKIHKVILYGIVRFGNAPFANEFTKIFSGRYMGVNNGRDWVYDLVPPVLFQHASPILWIWPGNSTNYYIFKNGEDRTLNFHHDFYLFYDGNPLEGLTYEDHAGYYMDVRMGVPRVPGPCPARRGFDKEGEWNAVFNWGPA